MKASKRFMIALAAFALALSVRARAAELEVAFSPDGGAEDLVVATIGAARSSIRMAAYSFTAKRVALALVDARDRGVDVRLLADQREAGSRYSAATFLAHKGIPVRLDGMHPIFHNKYIVVDGRTVETGSYNYSGQARRNAENALVIRDNPGVAKLYLSDWATHWAHASPLD